ncbi:Ras GTPase activating protein ira2, partial [Nowakowskiella sp. JEL0078]
MATKLLANYARAHGQVFLQAALRPILKDLVSRHPPLTFETDPSKIGPNEDPEVNLQNLQLVSVAFLNAIISNQKNIPPSISAVCAMISRVVGEKFPDATITGVGGFIFLRFVCPAIISPESHELVMQPISSKDLRRGLVLIAKVIQNLANNVLFGLKESFMVGFNDLLKENVAKLRGFLRDMANYDPSSLDLATVNLSRTDDLDVQRLHRHFARHIDKIERLPTSVIAGFYKQQSLPDTLTRNASPQGATLPRNLEPLLAAKQTISQLSTLLAQMGPPPDIANLESNRSPGISGVSGVGVLTNQQILEFMIRIESRPNSAKTVELLKEAMILFEGPVSKDNRPVMYYIARRFVPEVLDMEIVLYHILTTLRSVMKIQYELVIDVSKFSAENEWRIEWLERLETLLPYEVLNNCHKVFIYNCNSAMRKFIKKGWRLMSQRLVRRVVFVTSLSELHEHISPSDLRIPTSTVALETEINAVFAPVTKVTQYRLTTPVIIKMSQEHFQVTTYKKQDIMGLSTTLNDVYHISDVEDVITSTSRSDDQEFVVRVAEKVVSQGLAGAGTGSNTLITPIVFVSPKRDQIMNAIRTAKARFQLTKNNSMVGDLSRLRPSDVP